MRGSCAADIRLNRAKSSFNCLESAFRFILQLLMQRLLCPYTPPLTTRMNRRIIHLLLSLRKVHLHLFHRPRLWQPIIRQNKQRKAFHARLKLELIKTSGLFSDGKLSPISNPNFVQLLVDVREALRLPCELSYGMCSIGWLAASGKGAADYGVQFGDRKSVV